ncbi:hypothetical protein [Flavobacterium sp.]|uniref:hypothetical protein n=1 Tax=Flavobacterium sp. TaxID=239 RepID=UPI003D6C48EE
MKKVEDKPIPLISKKHLYHHKVELRLGNWKNNFDISYVNTTIAIALNHCCKYNDLIINGYLITTKNLYLIAKTNEKTIDVILNKIERHIHFLLKADNRIIKKNIFNIDFIVDDEDVFYEIHEPLFKVYPFKNDHLIQLITGKKVKLPYFDRKLEDLKLMILHHRFCSAIDYSGAIGPVDVTLLNNFKEN